MSKDGRVTFQETRRCVDSVCGLAEVYLGKGYPKEVLTADNHCDGPYSYLKKKKTRPEKAESAVFEL